MQSQTGWRAEYACGGEGPWRGAEVGLRRPGLEGEGEEPRDLNRSVPRGECSPWMCSPREGAEGD